MSDRIYIRISKDDLDKVDKMLAGVAAAVPRVISRSINDTMGGVKTDAASEISKVLNAKVGAIKDTMKIAKRATVANLSGLFQCVGAPIPLIDFKGTSPTKQGVSVKVKVGGPRKVIQGAFIATVKSQKQKEIGSAGHKGVLWRKWHEKSGKSSKMDSAIGRSGYIFNRKTGRYFPVWALSKKYRLPIEERYAPRVPDYFKSGTPIRERVDKMMDARMHKNIDRELNYELSKL